MTDAFQPARRASASPTLSETPEIQRVAFAAPFAWLAAGWRDLWTAPQISLAYGAIFSAFALAIAIQLSRIEALPLLLPLAGGFLLVGPILAGGLYEISRRHERGQSVTFRDILLSGSAVREQIAFFGAVLLILFFFWIRVALLLFMFFFGLGPAAFPPLADFLHVLLFTEHGQGLLVTGAAVGAVFAAVVFAMSAISVPMIFDRNIDTVTAMITSLRAVSRNLPAMALWAVLIVALTVIGLAAFFVGLAITFPLIGHATWHAYKALVK